MSSLRHRFLLLFSLLSFSVFASEVGTKFDIPAQPLPEALRLFADQAKMQLLYKPSAIHGGTSNAVVGEYESRAALKQLLRDTGLEVVFTTSNSATIRPLQGDGHGQKTSAASTLEEGGSLPQDIHLSQVEAAEDAAQNSRQGTDNVDQNAKKNDSSARIEEIVVTATKRAERIQDVPISITAITAEEIDQRGLSGSADYLRGIPGVNQTDLGYGGQAVVIRGIETTTQTQNFAAGPTTATYFGETPISSSAGLLGSNVDTKLVDIERVEVLRGPQGTAFGSASLGGAVRIIPVAPKLDRFEGKVSAAFSNSADAGGDNYNIQAVGNIPLIRDKLAIRAAVYQHHDSGFYRNLAGSDAAFRASLVTPANFVGVPVGVPYSSIDTYVADEDDVGAYQVLGGRISALFQASEQLRFRLNYLTQKSETDGYPGATSGPYDQTYLQVAPEHVFRGQSLGINDSDIDIANAVAEYDFGWGDVLATYSYIKSGMEHSVPLGLYGFLAPGSASQSSPHREHTGEIRLATKLEGAWNILVGVFAEKQEDDYYSDWRWFGDPAQNYFAPGLRDFLDYVQQGELKQNAAFTEVSWEFSPRFTLTGGVRVYDYERNTQVDSQGFGGAPSSSYLETEASGNNFRANLSYKPSDDALLYLGWAQGFRLGRPQQGIFPALYDRDNDGIIDGTSITIASTEGVDSDSIDSYEFGGKFTLASGRLTIDAAIFRMNWSDAPVFVRVETAHGLINYTENAGRIRSEGVELQANLRLTDALHLYVGGSYIDAQLLQAVPAQGWSAGDPLPAPKENANLGLQYGFDLAGHAAYVRADAIYVGPFHDNMLQLPVFEAGDYAKIDTSARVEVGKLDIDLFVRNLTNEDAYISRGYGLSNFYGHRLRPRTVGIQLGYSFE